MNLWVEPDKPNLIDSKSQEPKLTHWVWGNRYILVFKIQDINIQIIISSYDLWYFIKTNKMIILKVKRKRKH